MSRSIICSRMCSIDERCRSMVADVLVPNLRMLPDIGGQQVFALRRTEVNDLHAAFAQPVNPAAKGARFADHDGPDAELHYKTAAVPARRQRRDHYRVLVAASSPGLAECIRLTVD